MTSVSFAPINSINPCREKLSLIFFSNYSPQTSIGTVHEMLKHILDTANETGAFTPNTSSNMNLIRCAINMGLSDEDACAIIKVFSSEAPDAHWARMRV